MTIRGMDILNLTTTFTRETTLPEKHLLSWRLNPYSNGKSHWNKLTITSHTSYVNKSQFVSILISLWPWVQSHQKSWIQSFWHLPGLTSHLKEYNNKLITYQFGPISFSLMLFEAGLHLALQIEFLQWQKLTI